MISTVDDNRKFSLWNILPSEPFYILIPNIFIIRPIRFLFNYYIKPAKFLVIILPRNIWQKGNTSQCTSWLRLDINESNICREFFCIFMSVANLKEKIKIVRKFLEKLIRLS